MIQVECPYCAGPLDCHRAVDDAGLVMPTDGDRSVCIHCVRVSVWAGGQLRQATAEEQAAHDHDPRIAAVRKALAWSHLGPPFAP